MAFYVRTSLFEKRIKFFEIKKQREKEMFLKEETKKSKIFREMSFVVFLKRLWTTLLQKKLATKQIVLRRKSLKISGLCWKLYNQEWKILLPRPFCFLHVSEK